MKLDFWFDFNSESNIVINNLCKALSTYVHKDDLTISFRSIANNPENLPFHETYQFVKRKCQGMSFLKDLFDLYINNYNIQDAIEVLAQKFNLNKEELENNLKEQNSRKIILNHMEHAALQKINSTPLITMSHGFKIKGVVSDVEIKEVLIQMYEKDSGIEYCEENCER